MTESSNPHCIEPLKPVDPRTRRVLRRVEDAAVAAAAARDLLLVHAFGLRPGRATRDIDFGIAVKTWDQFEMLKRSLIESGEATSS